MLAIARYALKGPLHAATVAGILAVLSLFIPLLSLLSGAIVGLIILTQGLVSGTRVILVSIVGITAVTYLITQSLLLGVTIGLIQWLPLIILAEILRRYRSISFTLVSGMGIALLAVAIQFLVWPDAEDAWVAFLKVLIQDIQQQPGMEMQQDLSGITIIAHWMTLLLVAVTYSTFIATLMAGRWFQARLSGAQGFQQEFYAVRLGKGVATLVLVVGLASMLLQHDWLIAMLLTMLATFLYQGLAVIHNWSSCYQKAGMLAVVYVLMIIFPYVVGVVALLGVIDNWIDFRARFKSVPVNTDD